MRTVIYMKSAGMGQDIPDQKRELSDLCNARGWPIDRHYIDFSFKIGRSRSAFKKMLHSALAGEIQRIVIRRVHDVAAGLLEFFELVRDLDRAGCFVVCVGLGLETESSPQVRSLLAGLAELERATLEERAGRSYSTMLARGVRPGRKELYKLPPDWREKVLFWRETGQSLSALGRTLGVPKMRAWRAERKLEQEEEGEALSARFEESAACEEKA